ncbi:uncharacterized protein LOC142334038 [Lycorma delicatula]|uniref:uncharacterized protein LOC142334038 n=1 Tax=Lycorma delicatula TaxID=130591 RepID=UPI003F51ABBA
MYYLRVSMDAQTNDSVLEENPLSLPIKKEDMHETGQQEYLFVHLAKTDDDKLTIFKQSMDAQTDSSFLDEDPLSSSIKQEIKHETERTVHLVAPVAMIDDKLTTSRQGIIAETETSAMLTVLGPGYMMDASKSPSQVLSIVDRLLKMSLSGGYQYGV